MGIVRDVGKLGASEPSNMVSGSDVRFALAGVASARPRNGSASRHIHDASFIEQSERSASARRERPIGGEAPVVVTVAVAVAARCSGSSSSSTHSSSAT